MPFMDQQKTRNDNPFYRWVPALLMMSLIFTVSSFPSTSIPNYGSFDFLVKKSGHLLAYTTLALTYCHGLRTDGMRRAGLAWLLAVLFAISDEFHQSFVPGRTPWVVDILIDSSGALLGVLIWLVLHRKDR